MTAPRPTRLFHITAIANLPAIFATGALLSKNGGAAAGVNYQNIAHTGAQRARAARPVLDPPGGLVHDYVPFYFARDRRCFSRSSAAAWLDVAGARKTLLTLRRPFKESSTSRGRLSFMTAMQRLLSARHTPILLAWTRKASQVRPGRMFIHDSGSLLKPNYIINFPTKDHWRGSSKIKFIRDGLADLVVQVKRLGIRSIATPPLGCGNGGLEWAEVRPLIEAAFETLPDVEVRLFEPGDAPNPKSMEVRTKRPRMTAGRAAIVKVLDTYRELNYGLSRIEVQKLAYFLQEAGEPLRLQFVKHQYGPYSDALRHALNTMEGHFIRGLGDGVVEAEIEPTENALAEAEAFIADEGHAELSSHVERVALLIEGYQSSYGMELLASVHWVATHELGVRSVDDSISAVHNWSDRKRLLMQPAHIRMAWQRLADEGWLPGTH